MSLVDALARAKKQFDDKKTADYLKRTVPTAALGAVGGPGFPGFEILDSGVNPPVRQEPVKVPELPKMGMLSELGNSLGRVPSQTVSQILDMAAFVSGSKSLHEASEISQQLGRKDFPSDAPSLSSMDELSNASVSDFARYAVAESGQAIASIGSMMIPGAAARVVAAPVVKALIGYSPKMAKLVSAVGGPAKAAEYISAYAGGSLLEAGSISAEAFQKTGEMPERLRVAPWAMVAGALESMEPIVLLSRLRRVMPDIAEEAAKKSGRDLVKYVLGYAKDMGLEGGTEFAQTLLEEAGAEYATGKTAIESLGSLDRDSFARATAAGISGAAGGGLMRGIADTGSLFLDKKQAGGIDPVEPPTAGPNTDITIPEPVKPTPGAQAPVAPVSAADEVIPPQYQDQLLGAVEKAKQLTAKADVGENDHPVQAGAKKLIRKINDTLAGIGVTGDMVNQFATEIGGSPIESMQLPQLQQVYQAAVTLAAQGHTVAAPIQVPPQPVQQAPLPLAQTPSAPAMQPPVQRPENIEQAIAMAQQQAQIKQAQPAAPQITQPARQPMGITQPEMEPRKLMAMPKLPTVEQINAMEQEELDAARKAIGGVLYAKPDEYPVEVIEAADALDAAAAKRQESLNIKREEEDEKPIYSKFVPHESGDISAEMTYAIRPEAYQKIYGKPGAIVSIKLKGKGLKSETGFMSVAGVTTSDTSPEGLRGLMDRVIAEQSKPAEAPRVKKSKTSGRPKLDMNALLYSEPETTAPTTTPMPAVNPFRAIVDKFDHEEFNKPDFKPDTVYRARMVKARRALKAAIKKAGKLTPSIDVAIEQMKKFNGLRSIADMVDAGMTKPAPAPAPAPEPEPETELTLEQQLAEAKEQLKQAEYQPIKAGGVPVMDARKEQRKRELREKIQRLEAAIPTYSPPPAPEPIPATTPTQPAPSYGESNTLVTKSRYEELKAKFNSKTKNIASGIDPELMAITAEMAVYHLEAGARKFADFAKAIIADVGESFRPYLKSAYLSAKYFPGAEKYRAEMDSESDIDAAVEPAAAPAPTPAPSVGKVGEINIPALSEALVPTVESFLTADKPMDNKQLKKVMLDLGVDISDPNYNHKITQEAIEGAIVRVIRKNNLYGNYDALIKLYENQPPLTVRTADSIKQQAYSTPVPLVAMVTDAIGTINNGAVIYEPTAGNGLLLSGLSGDYTYYLNEIDNTRDQILRSLYPDSEISNQDALDYNPPIKVDAVFTNPPFGTMENPVQVKTTGELKISAPVTKLEHAIAWKALENMKDNGKAVLIMGAEKENKISGNAKFMRLLYNQYNITGHFELSGDLYGRQGAKWPVMVITIEGRKSFPKDYINPPTQVRRAENWNEVKQIVSGIQPGVYINRKSDIAPEQRPDTRPEAGIRPAEGATQQSRPEDTQRQERPSDLAGAVSAVVGSGAGRQPRPDSRRDTEPGRDTGRDQQEPAVSTGTQRREDAGPVERPRVDDTGVVETELQSAYAPVSKSQSVNSLVPVNLKNPIESALKDVLNEVDESSLDDYVAHQLGYESADDLYRNGQQIFSGEQIDALSLTFRNFQRNGGTIIADQTGVGKGRVASGAIQWAANNGKIPLFVTERADLFNDIYRDMADTNGGHLRPFIFNADGVMLDNNQKQVYAHNPSVYKAVFKRISEGDYSDFVGENKKFDYMVATYSQFNTKDNRKFAAILRAPKNSLVAILDEAHNAAGEESNQGNNFSALIDPENTSGVLYLSATWAKRPEQMKNYRRAFGRAGLTIDEINAAFERGGIAIQEMQVANMARNGSYLRREQSYAGVTFERLVTVDETKSNREIKQADETMERIRKIIDLGAEADQITPKIDDLLPDDFKGADAKGNYVTATAAQPTSPFSSVHNYVSSFLSALKADQAADEAISMIKKGQKPVICIQNTRGSQMDFMIDIGKGKINEPFSGTFADTLELMLEKITTITVTSPFDKNKQLTVKIPLDRYPPAFVAAFEALREEIAAADIKDMPFSPIDYVKNKIAKAGYSTGEITGRDKILDYSGDTPILKLRDPKEQSIEGKQETIKKFNSGELDAMIFNVAGATGMSLHSSVKFKDQRQRMMLILQPFDDINKFMQALGRIHRVGEITDEKKVTSRLDGKPAAYGYPGYKYLQSSLDMEVRPAIQIEKKMKSLNANTSSNAKGHQKVSEIDVMNKYGLQVMRDWVSANPDAAAEIGYDGSTELKKPEQITGRLAILLNQVQTEFWSEVLQNYQELIEQLDASGTNDLVIPTYKEANAKTLEKKLVFGEEGNPDTPPIYVERVEMTIEGNPTSFDAAMTRAKSGSTVTDEQVKAREGEFEEFIRLKIAERDKRLAENKSSAINPDAIRLAKSRVVDDVKELKPGTMVSGQDNQIGIIEKVELGKSKKGLNPFNPGNVKITMSAPNAGGQIIISLAGFRRYGFGKSFDEYTFKRLYGNVYDRNKTRREVKEMLTGDMIRAAGMTKETVAVQFQREDGGMDFGWMSDKKPGQMEIKPPPISLTDQQLRESNPPYVITPDKDSSIIVGNIYKDYGESRPSPKLETNRTTVKVAKTSRLSSAVVNDPAIRELLSQGPQDEVFVIERYNGRQYYTTKNLRLDETDRGQLLSLLRSHAESAGTSLVEGDVPGIDKVVVPRMASPRSGAIPADLAAIPAISAKWAARKLTSALESAYNALVRGSGSFIDWIKTLAGEARRVAAEIWKDARKLAAAMKIPSLNRKGAIMSLPQAIKIVKEQLAQKPLPQPGESVVTEKAAVEVAVESFKTGVAEEKVEAKVRSDKRAARLKESAAARYEKLKDKLGKLKKMNQAQRLIRTEGKKFLIDLANRLPVAERASLIRGIANADTILAQADVINRIDKLIDKVVRRNSAKRFQAALRGAKQLRPEFQGIADELKKNIVTRGHIVEALDAMNKYLLDNPTAIVSEERLETLRRLAADRSGKLNPITMDMFSELLETITFLSNQENERVFANNAMTAAQNASAIINHVEKQPDISSTDESWAKWFFNIGSLQFEAITDMLGDAGRELFYGDMRRGERKAKEIWFAGRDAIHETMREIGLDPDDLKTAEWLDQDVGGMTRNERMNLVANLLDKSTREEIIRGGYKLKNAKKDEPAVQISERDADMLIASLDKKEAAMVKTMRRFLNTTLKSAVNESWVQLAGYEKALADDYWPRTRDIKQTGLNEGYRKWANTALEQLGIFKQREKSKAAVMVGGIMETYQNHLKKASTFAGLSVPIRNTEIVLAKISDKVESRYGKKYLDRVKEQLSAMADLGNPTGGEMNAGAAAVLNRVSVSLLGANVRAAAKQFGGLFTASTEISPALLRDSIGDAFNADVRQEMMDNSPILRDRYDSSGARLVSPVFDSGEDIVKTSRADYYRRLLMLPLEKCDQAVSQIIWSAAKKELKATGLKGQELLTATAERAEQIVSRTQNVTSILDMSGVALEGRKSVWWKVMTLFQSQGNSIYNILRRAVKDYRTGKIDSAQLMGVVSLALAGNAVWSMVIGNLVTLRGWGDDDEEDKEKKTAKMISEITFDLLQENAGIFYGGSLFGAPFLRQAKRIVNKELIGLKDTRVQAGSARVENAMESAANSGLQAAEHFLTASLTAGQKIKTGPNRGKFKSEVELKKGILKAARLTASMTGVPMILLNEGSNLLYDK